MSYMIHYSYQLFILHDLECSCMNKDIKVSPLGELAISIYESKNMLNHITNQSLESVGETLLTTTNLFTLSNRIYQKALVCLCRWSDLEDVESQIKSEKAKCKEKKIKMNNQELLSQKNTVRVEFDKVFRELQYSLNIWFYSFGSRASKNFNVQKRRPIYNCDDVDKWNIVLICKRVNCLIGNMDECQDLFYNILIYASGGIIDARYNFKQVDAKISLFLEEATNQILPPKIEAEMPQFDSEIHTLYIYKGVIGCFRNRHHLAGVNALVPTASGLTVLLNATYCADCNRFYISCTEYSYYMEQYKSLLTKFVLNESMQSNSAFGSLADKSPLKLCGYSVSQEKGLTQKERENILYEMISRGIVSKPEAMQYIEWFIRFNGNREINQPARSKWESDLNYIRNLNVANQPNQKIDFIKPYQK